MYKRSFCVNFLLILGFFLTVVNTGAAEEKMKKNLPVYMVHYAKGNIVVDGKLDEKDWKSAPSVSFVFPWPKQRGKQQKTEAKLLWDKENFYVAYICEDTDITAKCTQRDDPVWSDNCVEIFISPNPEKMDCYYGLEMNARGVLYDYFRIPKICHIKRVDFKGVLLKTNIEGTLNNRGDKDKGWMLELAIPFSNFVGITKFSKTTKSLPPDPGSSWRINLNRWDGKEKRCLSQWSASDALRPDPHRPARFGIIVFSKEQD